MHGRNNGIKPMLKLFERKPRSLLGVDITAVKILEISNRDGAFIVENYGREVFPPNTMDGHVIKDIDVVAGCIKKVSEKLHTSCRQVALAVPDAAIISKVIQINANVNDLALEELVLFEADKYIPYPINEINLDFEVLGYAENNPNILDILIVASRAADVNQRVDTVTRAGLDVLVVDVASYAVARAGQYLTKALPLSGQDKIIAIIDIGATYTHLFVLHGMKLIYSREEKFGGKQLIESIAEHDVITLEQAAFMQAQPDFISDYEIKILESFKENILIQIKRALQFFYSTSQGQFVNHILLAGGGAKLPGLLSLVQSRLGIAISIANPFTYMAFGKNVYADAINTDAPTLMVSCGLALRTFG
jgi:type IV pilus assembly protein PilM